MTTDNVKVTSVTLSEAGVALILLEQELTNNALRLTRLLSRRIQIEDDIELARVQRKQLELTLATIKAVI